ncbi:BolA family transcriptional regulator [Gammaproteobacteria bacterium]|nr:BolA family transcriptional regulator [Gammaproteobacteria bacterium]
MSIHEAIIEDLNMAFSVEHLYLENESSMHKVPPNSESHFKLVIVSNDFNHLSKVKRHQNIYSALNAVMNKIHALSIQAFTIDEYDKNPVILKSPDCSKK